MFKKILLIAFFTFSFTSMIRSAEPQATSVGKYHTVSYDASSAEKGLKFKSKYQLWLPDCKKIRGVIVHQHGCGTGAHQGGETAVYDLHWQALARKHDCALIGPVYYQMDSQPCEWWCDPRNGSDAAFQKALKDLAELSKHPELETVPWCLWGHSGGGFWATLMQTLYTERIAGIWLRSGTSFSSWGNDKIPMPKITDAIYQVPVMLNPGLREKGDKQFNGIWTASLAMLKEFRSKDAVIGLAVDPVSSHDCADSRYLAIPFFDYCLQQRLPKPDDKIQTLKAIDIRKGFAAKFSDTDISKEAAAFETFKTAPKELFWLPDEKFAKAWQEYVSTGMVSDQSAPPAPFDIQLDSQTNTLRWNCEADFESGLKGFIILRDGEQIAELYEKQNRKKRPLFQKLSYHDTPEKNRPEMKYVDEKTVAGKKHVYEVISINGAGLKSNTAK